MEIKSCPMCGAEMHGTTTCENCKHTVNMEAYRKAGLDKRKTGENGPVMWIAALIFGGLLWWGYSALSTPDDPSAYKPNEAGAWVAMKQFVESRLKSPSTADFPLQFSEYVTYQGDRKYLVSAYVDSQNSFGATIRTRFRGVVRDGSDEWVLVSLDLYD